MKMVLDSHAFVWWLTDDARLSRLARRAIENAANEVLVSAIVAWELATKVRLGKWAEASSVTFSFEDVVAREGFSPLSISVTHGRIAGLLPGSHRDPFDRMLAAQAQVEGAPLV